MKKADLVILFGTQQAIADFLGIGKSAVSQWPELVPELRQYQIREKDPQIDRKLAAARRRETKAA